MAEFTLGLTKTAVDGTLSLVKSAVEEEKRLRDTVQSDLVFITGEFEVMRSFLRVANRKRTANDEVALTLVRQLRTLAFDVEDCVEFIIHLEKPAGWEWLRRLWQKANCRAPPLSLDVAVAEIKQLKARVEDVSQRNTRYHQILQGSDNDNNKQHVAAMPLPYATTTTTYPSSSPFHDLREAWKATGKWSSNICNLQQELLIAPGGEDDHDLQVISVWGSSASTSTGGGGADLVTASIFRKAYSDSKICENFKIRAWVKLTHPFNHDEFVKSLLSQFCANPHQANAEFTEGNIMRRQRYLVVVENVFTLEEWNVIRTYLPDCKNGSRILLSTSRLGVALTSTGEPYQVSELRQFYDDNQFLCAFSKKEKTPSGIGEFVHQLLRDHGVISVWGADDDDKSKLVDILYGGIINGWLEEIEGVADKSDHVDMSYEGIRHIRKRKIEQRHRSWVCVPDPFNLKAFARGLFLNFRSARGITKAGMEGEEALIEWCRQFLSGEKSEGSPYVVVINGLRSNDDWDQIQRTFLVSSKATTTAEAAGCILVITEEETVATHCVKDHTYLVFNAQDLMMDPSISALTNKKCRHIVSTRKRYQDAIQWVKPIARGGEVAQIRSSTVLVSFSNVVFSNVVSVWGISGVGKSTLVRTVYYTEICCSLGLESPLFGIGSLEAFAWVDVLSPFNLTDFAWRLLFDFYSDDPQAKEAAIVSLIEEGHQVPILECCKILRIRKCLVVIDGLRSKQDWDVIKDTFLAKPNQGIIVVVTNEEEVAMHCGPTINITGLEASAALSLFKKIAWEDKELTPREKVVSESIVARCGGLPKVIAAIGEVVAASYDRSRWLESLSDNFLGTLERPRFHDRLRPLFSWMQSYFDACSDSIKPCIFYLSIFPPAEKKSIRRRRLLWRWIVEGYCRDTSDGKTYEENGEKSISALAKLSIIQESAKNKVFCEINAFFHEYIISRRMEDNLVFALEKGCSLNSQRAGQHLTIRSTWDRSDEIVYKSIDFLRLRSLTVFGKWESSFVSINMRLLRVLDLEDATDVEDEHLEEIAKQLTRLKFLSLRGHTKITRLPSSMGGLRQLQTLDIRGTSIVTLPPFITKLQKLRYIRAGTTTEVWDWEGDVVSADGEEEEDRASSSAPTEAGTNSTPPVLAPDAGNNRPRTSVSGFFLSKLCRLGGGGHDNNNGGPPAAAGVRVPADIGNLSVLHTLGVVKVNAECGSKAIFQELKKLTQLRKLGVSGINKGNIHEFCKAISGHAHLKSLSVEVDKDDGDLDELDDNIPEPPKAIKSLKLYGRVNKLLVWMNKLLDNLEKLHLTIEKPEELRDPPELSCKLSVHLRLRIRPIQDGDLHISHLWSLFTQIIEIQCSSRLHIKLGVEPNWWRVELLKVHFSGGSRSSLQISGLRYLVCLQEVWLKGYNDAHKQDMQRQINEMNRPEGQRRPVLKLVQPRSS